MAIKYRQIADELRKQIISAKSLVPYKLPTEKELCEKYRVSRQTIRQALHTLTEERLITSRQGSGIYTIPLTEHLNEKKIILLISENNEYIYPGFIADVRNGLRRHKLSLTVYAAQNNHNQERAILKELVSQSVSVLLVEGIQDAFPNPNLDLYEKMQFSGTHILFINTGYPQLQHTSFVRSNDFEGGYLLGEYFIAADLEKITCILPDFAANAKERYAGLLSAYRDHSLIMPSDHIFWYSQSDLRDLRARQNTDFLTTFIKKYFHNQDAILCYSDEIAYWLIKELTYAGIKVPEQVSVTGFDNSYLCTLSSPPITSLTLPASEPGNSITQFIISLLQEKSLDDPNRTYNSVKDSVSEGSIYRKTLPWNLIPRSSVLTSSYD